MGKWAEGLQKLSVFFGISGAMVPAPARLWPQDKGHVHVPAEELKKLVTTFDPDKTDPSLLPSVRALREMASIVAESHAGSKNRLLNITIGLEMMGIAMKGDPAAASVPIPKEALNALALEFPMFKRIEDLHQPRFEGAHESSAEDLRSVVTATRVRTFAGQLETFLMQAGITPRTSLTAGNAPLTFSGEARLEKS
jgi:hypothetical protein